MDVALEPDRLSQSEAVARREAVSNVSYRLDLSLTAGSKTYEGKVEVRFAFAGDADTFLDFTGSTIELFEINGVELEPAWHDNRVALPASRLAADNLVRVHYVNEYDHTGEGFHQFVDPEDGSEYLYTQLEPFAAHRLLPCFDQPDLKAPFEIHVTAPAEWEVMTSSRQTGVAPAPDGRLHRSYERSVPFSPYLVSVVAGPYHVERAEHNGLPLAIYVRATLAQYLDAGEMFGVTKAGLDYFADFFGHPYPFSKYDQIFVPEFNWGGMENVANVTYTDIYIFRDPPTTTQLMDRAEVLLHELAHMWFGNLVTMKWWNDVWLNESFATYMAFRALEAVTDYPDTWQYFQSRMKVWAYQQDQLPTTHRIADNVPTTDETFLNFDGITYGKGAAALKQLVAAVGEEAFASGMKAYFRDHAFGNATLAEFLDALSQGGGVDLTAWSQAWLESPSLNTLQADWAVADGRLQSLILKQTAPSAFPTLRPHTTEIAVVTRDGDELHLDSLPAQIDGPETAIDVPALGEPVLVYPNYRDLTFAKVELDPRSLDFALGNIQLVSDSLFRQMLWMTLWEMTRDARMSSSDYLELICERLPQEENLQIIRLVSGTATAALRRYVPEDRIEAEEREFFAAGLRALESVPPGDARVLWMRSMLRVAGKDDLATAGRIVDGEREIDGLAIDQDMRWAVALRWAAHDVEGWERRLDRESGRDPSDRGREYLISAEVSRPSPEAKEEAWGRLHGDGYGSLHLDIAAMKGFGWREQRELLDPYVDAFFAHLPEVFETREHEAAKAYLVKLWPTYRVGDDILRAAGEVLAAVDGPPQLERLLLEEIDRIERAIRVRAAATV
jgi:aminopeptidase N